MCSKGLDVANKAGHTFGKDEPHFFSNLVNHGTSLLI